MIPSTDFLTIESKTLGQSKVELYLKCDHDELKSLAFSSMKNGVLMLRFRLNITSEILISTNAINIYC
jgi:hypothetical protein